MRERTEEGLLCAPDGRLDPRALGWSRTPLLRANLCGSPLRKKRWDYFCVTGEEAVFAVTLADVDYVAFAAASLFDVRRGRWIERVAPARVRLPETARGGDIVVERRGFRVAVHEEGETTRIEARWARGAEAAEANVAIDRRGESLSVVIPFAGAGASRFQLTTKAAAMAVRGFVSWDGTRVELSSPHAFACHDHGRGVWPYRTRWQWAAAGGVRGGRTVGFNLGGTWTRGSGATENAVFDGGRVFPIDDDLVFEPGDGGAPRRIRTAEGARASVDLVLDAERTRRLDVQAVVLSTHLRWALGRFRGRIALPGHEPVELEGLRGFAEDHRARW